nr:alpha/beta fold hydrolase [uncultured Flavobacterium sp.]
MKTKKTAFLQDIYQCKTAAVVLLVSFLLSSCAFNNAFLYPGKIDSKAASFKIRTYHEDIDVRIDPKTYQPLSIKTGNKEIEYDYTIESVIFTSKNGNKLNGWFLKPKNMVPAITLLHLHGSSRNIYFHHQAISPLLKQGFQIFTFDYSGFGLSEGKATRKNVLTDALSALDYLKTRKEINGTKLVVYGQSLGGNLAAAVGAKKQNDIDALVIEGAFSSHRDIASESVPVLGKIFVREHYSSKKEIKKYRKPLLVIHSTEDRRIPYYMGERIFENANEPKEFYQVDKYHIGALQFYSEEIASKIKKMLQKT